MVMKKKGTVVVVKKATKKTDVKKTPVKRGIKPRVAVKKKPTAPDTKKKDQVKKPNPNLFKTGNKFWQSRTLKGKSKIFSSPESLWYECQEYFKWADKTPIGNKRRPYTIGAMCIRMGIGTSTWEDYRNNKTGTYSAYSGIISMVDTIIYTQKFEGAVISDFNANIISRELGLVDKTKQDTTVNIRFDSEDEDA